MEVGIKKCNRIILRRGFKDENCDIMLPKDLKISSLKGCENYKYLEILEAKEINSKKMKEKVKAERLTRKVLYLKLNSGNLFGECPSSVTLLHL